MDALTIIAAVVSVGLLSLVAIGVLLFLLRDLWRAL